MKNSDALKKHHFWILLGFVPLFVLIAVLVISSSVGGAIADRDKKITDATKEISSKTNPKPVALITKLEETNARVASKKGDLWKENWERQAGIDPVTGKQDPSKNLFTWPNSTKLKAIERMGLKFGDKIPNDDGQYNEFRRDEVYLAEYSNARPGFPGTGMADKVAPTQFRDGWERILRHVNARSDVQLTSEQIWLMLEDIWVQRSLLNAVQAVNDEMAEFKRVKFEKNGQVIDDPASKTTQDPLRRKFRSPTWELELEVERRDNQPILVGRLTNITNRLQLMGLNNIMVVKVWLEPGTDGKGKGVEPFEFRIGGESLKGVGAVNRDGSPANTIVIAPLPDQQIKDYINLIPPGKNIVEIVRVQQVFDTRTVPVRRIESLALGYPDSRTASVELVAHKTMQPKEDAGSSGSSSSTTTVSTGGSSSLGGGPPAGMTSGIPRDGTGGGSGTPSAVRSGGGTVAAVLDANKKRYLVANEQVRRMPVGIVLVVDQANIQDVLLAFANSPLRFQITQVDWVRFRGNLGGAGGGSSGSTGEMIVTSGPGDSSIRGGGDDDADRPRGSLGMGPPRGMGVPPGGGYGGGSLGGPIRPGTSGGGTSTGGGLGTGGGSNVFGTPLPYGPGGMGGYFPGGSGGLTTVSESQLTSGLVELSIYGIVSLYEKYTPPTDANAADAKDKDKDKDAEPKTDTKTPTDPEPKQPEQPKDPMTTTPTSPKMRRRIA